MTEGQAATLAAARTATVQLRPRGTAPRLARALVRDLAEGSRLPQHAVDDAAFILGELVITSIRDLRRPTVVTVELDDSAVTVRVHDDGGRLDGTGVHASGGAMRRWEVVRRLATSWGYARDDRQRELWATIRIPSPLAA